MGRGYGTRRVVLATLCLILGYCAPALEPVSDVLLDGGDDVSADGNDGHEGHDGRDSIIVWEDGTTSEDSPDEDTAAWDDGRIEDAEAEVPPGVVCDEYEHAFSAADEETCRIHPFNRDNIGWSSHGERCASFTFSGLSTDEWPYVQVMVNGLSGSRHYWVGEPTVVIDANEVWVQDTLTYSFRRFKVRYCR